MLRSELAFSIQTAGEQVPNLLLGMRDQTRLRLVEWYQAQLRIVGQPWKAQQPVIRNASPASITDVPGALIDWIKPALYSSCVAHHRSIAMRRCLRVFNALQAFAQQNGREATGLAELDLPAEMTTDPFTDQPLVCKLRDDADGNRGWWIYTVMDNEVDDGGKFDDASDYGLRPLGSSLHGD